ncbi:MAG: hypothetical protein HOE90_22405 [Bacteriovoracaceae bacterium]|jgi:hypothetical protein|nr:hypothetical protein [Bacteriovoracaceae bacterium]
MKQLLIFLFLLPCAFGADLKEILSFELGTTISCAHLNENGAHSIVCEGLSVDKFKLPASMNNPDMFSVGFNHLCATKGSKLVCTGPGLSISRSVSSPSQLSSGKGFACLQESGNLVCFGSKKSSRLSTPSIRSVKKISLADSHGCALDEYAAGKNRVVCWGDTRFGKVDVPAMVNPVDISVGRAFSCAIDQVSKDIRTIRCWGKNDKGQSSPVLANYPLSLTTGKEHGCVIDQKNHWGETKVLCWGSNQYGQLNIPVIKDKDPLLVRSASYYNCIYFEDHGIECFGGDDFGQLGISSWLFGFTPNAKILSRKINTRKAGVALFYNPSNVDVVKTKDGEAYNAKNYIEKNTKRKLTTFTDMSETKLKGVLATNGTLVFPEFEKGSLTLGSNQTKMIQKWLKAGNSIIVMGGNYNLNFAKVVTGSGVTKTYRSGTVNYDATAAKNTPFQGKAKTLPNPSDSSNRMTLGSLPATAKAIYKEGVSAGVVLFKTGKGHVVYLCWDWYNAKPVGAMDGGWLDVFGEALRL